VTDGTPHADVRRRAGWLPGDQEGLERWLSRLVDRAASRGDDVTLHPVLVRFQELIARDALVRMQLERMLEEEPQGKPYSRRHVQSVDQLLRLLDEVLRMAPEFSEDSMVITPVAAVLDWAMGTPSGFAAFRNPTVNAMLKEVLTAWCAFLDSPDSLYVLDDSPAGWRGEAARTAIGIDQYEHDPDDEHWGFTSWNDFFTRRFREGERPVASPDDDKVIVSACESTPYAISRDVARRDRFWVKSQSYSLQDMLADDPSVDAFVGGTVYQAYLSATDYHRWHAPVGGTVVRAFTVDGTYYSDADSEGAQAAVPQESQGYMAHVAARAVIVIDADDPAIGLVAFVPVGMADVSSCLIDEAVVPGKHVTKGQEVGRFQFGGSTHCLVFRPGVIADIDFQAVPQPHDPQAPLVRVRSRIATAR
jgi:phosphatidylserine decarboxylase